MDSIDANFVVMVFDTSGVVINEVSGKSESFLKNFMLFMQAAMAATGVSIRDTEGVYVSGVGFSACPTEFDQTDRGIVIGTGTTPVTAEDFALSSELGTDVIQYSPGLFEYPSPPYVDGGVIRMDSMNRAAVNRSQDPIEITEFGVKFYSGGHSYLVIRDVVSPGIVLNPGYTMTLRYQFGAAV